MSEGRAKRTSTGKCTYSGRSPAAEASMLARRARRTSAVCDLRRGIKIVSTKQQKNFTKPLLPGNGPLVDVLVKEALKVEDAVADVQLHGGRRVKGPEGGSVDGRDEGGQVGGRPVGELEDVVAEAVGEEPVEGALVPGLLTK